MEAIVTKKCRRCGNEKEISNFRKRGIYLQSYCNECSKEYAKDYRNENLEKVNGWQANWKKNNPERAAIIEAKKKKRWEQSNPEKVRVRNKNNCANRRAMKIGAGGKFTAQEFQELCDKYNNSCLCCGEKRKLTADHVIPLSCGGVNEISNIQPLCGSCNSKKGTKVVDYR